MKKQTTNESASKAPKAAKTTKKSKVTEVAPADQQNQGAVEDNAPQLQIDMEYMKTVDLHCVVHCPNGSVSENTFISFIKFGNVAKQLGIEWSVETTVNEPIPSRAKNMLAAKFMTIPNKTHLLMVDPEISFEPWHILVLLDRQVDFISGLYPVKTMPVRWSVTTFEGAEEGEDGMHEVDRVGTGFALFKREAFEKIRDHNDVDPYTNDVGLGPDFDQHLYTYFDASVKDGKFVSEDADFCAKWRSLGHKIWVDKRVSLANKGFFNYSALSQDVLLNSFGPMYLEFMKNQGKIQVIEAPAEAQA